MIKDDNYLLSNGVSIPKIGFGTWQIPDGDEAYLSCLEALKAGYRHIDTAAAYGNEKSVARAIKDSKIDRKDIFITTKLPAEIKSYDGAMKYFNQSLENLDTDYLDLYLIHAPWPWNEIGKDCSEGNIEVWKAFVDLYKMNKVRSIGVSNFFPSDIENIVNATGFVPHVNQIRFFISNTQEAITSYCQKNNILIEAYSPLATGKLIDDENIVKIAEKYNVSPAQLCLRYCLERNTLPIPKSTHKDRIIKNLDVDFKIEVDDMNVLDSIKEREELKKKMRS